MSALSPVSIHDVMTQLGGVQTDVSCSSSYDENTIEGVWVAVR